jgi:hypothetical protein
MRRSKNNFMAIKKDFHAVFSWPLLGMTTIIEKVSPGHTPDKSAYSL